MAAEDEIRLENIDRLIQKNMAFLIRTVSDFTGRYVSIENDDEFSIALAAFAEAVEKYEPERGAFLSFVKLVVVSRLKSFQEKENKWKQVVSLDELQEEEIQLCGRQDCDDEDGHDSVLREEILQYREELLLFGLTLEHLAQEAPRHRDTREKALDVARQAGGDEHVVAITYEKKKLPVREVARLACVTEKIVKKSKIFILASMIIFVRRFPGLLAWIQGVRCARDVS